MKILMVFFISFQVMNFVSAFGFHEPVELNDPIVKFEVVEDVSVRDLWNFAPPKYIFSNFSQIGYWEFDEHEVRIDGDWVLSGVIIAGVEDTASGAIGANVWIKNGVTLFLEESKSISAPQREAVAIFVRAGAACNLKSTECERDQVLFIVRENGVVVADQEEIGIIEY